MTPSFIILDLLKRVQGTNKNVKVDCPPITDKSTDTNLSDILVNINDLKHDIGLSDSNKKNDCTKEKNVKKS